jgi:hypothetical protein
MRLRDDGSPDAPSMSLPRPSLSVRNSEAVSARGSHMRPSCCQTRCKRGSSNRALHGAARDESTCTVSFSRQREPLTRSPSSSPSASSSVRPDFGPPLTLLPHTQGNPAGGRFRSKLGKSLFRTTKLEQNLYEPNVVVNKVAFRFLSVLPGMVTLKGTLAPEPEGQGTWVRASFDQPKLSLLGLPALVRLSRPSVPRHWRAGPFKAGVRTSTAGGAVGDGAIPPCTRSPRQQALRERP